MAEETRRGHSTPPAPALDAQAQGLQARVGERLAGWWHQLGACLDIPTVTVRPQDVVEVCRALKEDPELAFNMLLCLAAVDYRDSFQMVYLLLSLEQGQVIMVKVDLSSQDPRLPTVSDLWRSADWYEREAHDLFGITFEGHPYLEPLLLYPGFEGYPGRKSFPFHDYQEW